jgi:hypothetical protein
VIRVQFVAQNPLAASHMQSALVEQLEAFLYRVPQEEAQSPVDESMQLASSEQVAVSPIKSQLGAQTPSEPSQRQPLSALQDTVRLYRAAQPLTQVVLLGLARQMEISLHVFILVMAAQLAPQTPSVVMEQTDDGAAAHDDALVPRYEHLTSHFPLTYIH